MTAWWLRLWARFFCVLLSRICQVICTKLIHIKNTKHHPIVVFWASGAVFLLTFKPHTLDDLLKINSQKNEQKMMSVW